MMVFLLPLRILEKIDSERQAVADWWIQCRIYNGMAYPHLRGDGENLHECIRNNEAQRDRCTSTINTRYIFEDVPMAVPVE